MEDVREYIKKFVYNNQIDFVRANDILLKNKVYVGKDSIKTKHNENLSKNNYDFDAKSRLSGRVLFN